MTTNHHTPISIGAPANASTFNTPLGQLDSAITDLATDVSDAVSDVATNTTTLNNLISGATGFTQLNLSTTTTLTLASGAITVTRSRHLVDTEASASYDDLDTINGGVAGDVLVLQSVTSARVVVVKNGTGNIFLNGFDVFLDNPRKALTLMYDGTQWVLMGEAPQQIDRVQAKVVFANTTSYPVGTAVGISSGTASYVSQAEGYYVNYASAASANSRAGVQGVALGEIRHHPSLTVWLKTGASIANLRAFIGFFASGIYGAGDALTGISAVMFRYSTAAGDVGWRPVTSNGTTQTVHAQLGGNLAINTAYKLQVNVVNGIAYFVVNDSAYFSTALTLPTSTTVLVWNTDCMTLDASAKSLLLKHVALEVN